MPKNVVAVILARAGSRGLPGKNALTLAGRPMIAWTLDDALAATTVDDVVVTTDLNAAADVARGMNVLVIDRPAELASDTATVDSAARHAVEQYEARIRPVSHVVVLYANVPIRAPGIIDAAVAHLLRTGCDSVRSVRPVEKQHPDWLHRLSADRMAPFCDNAIYRRQDLEPLYYHDGAVVAVTRASLFTVDPARPHAFFGADRRAVVASGGPTVDIDDREDFDLAEAILLHRRRAVRSPVAASEAARP